MDGAKNNCLLDPRQECFGLKEAAALRKELEELKSSNSKSHDRFFTRLEEMEKHSAVRDEQYKHIIEKLDNLTTLVNLEREKPGKRWESMIDKIFMTIVGAVITFLLVKMGLV